MLRSLHQANGNVRLTNKNSETYPDGAVVGESVLDGEQGIRGVWGGVWSPCIRYLPRKQVCASCISSGGGMV